MILMFFSLFWSPVFSRHLRAIFMITHNYDRLNYYGAGYHNFTHMYIHSSYFPEQTDHFLSKDFLGPASLVSSISKKVPWDLSNLSKKHREGDDCKTNDRGGKTKIEQLLLPANQDHKSITRTRDASNKRFFLFNLPTRISPWKN